METRLNSILSPLKKLVLVSAIALTLVSCGNILLSSLESNPWQVESIETEATFSDLAFTKDPRHGWLVGSRSTLLETNDGGKTWEPRQLELGAQNYTFTTVSFKGDDGWITGIPNLLLHTPDGGQSWENVPLSTKLPGSPFSVTALGKDSAEMVTEKGLPGSLVLRGTFSQDWPPSG
ncbi:MAG: YCF48-related protein, partial [Cyanobacteria bacterium J06629_9]